MYGPQCAEIHGMAQMLELFAGNLDSLQQVLLMQSWDLQHLICPSLVGSIAIIFGSGFGTIGLNYVRCNGNEERLIDCQHQTSSRYCSHADDAGVRCQQRTGK